MAQQRYLNQPSNKEKELKSECPRQLKWRYVLLRVGKQDGEVFKGQEIGNPKQNPQKLKIHKRSSHQIPPENESKWRKWKKTSLENPIFAFICLKG